MSQPSGKVGVLRAADDPLGADAAARLPGRGKESSDNGEGQHGAGPCRADTQDIDQSMRYHKQGKKPYKNVSGELIWTRSRIWLFKILESTHFEMWMAALIVFNMILIIRETDIEARCHPEYTYTMDSCPHRSAPQHRWLGIVNTLLLVVYSVEASLRVYVERSEYHKNGWNCLDLSVVSAGWLAEILGGIGNIQLLRFLRTFRLLRVLRIMIAFRELYLLVTGFMYALRAIAWGSVMVFVLMTLWSILLVEFVHPISSAISFEGCERCAKAFNSVMDANLTLFQTIVAGDSWGQYNVPVILEDWRTAIIICAIVLTVSLGLMNLILAVIVERAAEARENDLQDKLRQKELAQEEQKLEFYKLCQEMDSDGNGTLSLPELLASYDANERFRSVLQLMDIQREELQTVFKVLDKDGSGDVSYSEFCEQLHQLRSRDTRTMLTFMKLSIGELRDNIDLMKSFAIRPLCAASEGQAQLLEHQGRLLLSIDRKLGGGGSGLGAACLAPPLPRDPPSPLAGPRVVSPSAASPGPGLSLQSAVPPPSADRLLSDLSRLGLQTQELAGRGDGLLRRVEQQAVALARHAGTLASLGDSVRFGLETPGQAPGPQRPAPLSSLSPARLGRAEDKLGRMQENLRRELSGLFLDIEVRLEEGAAALARSGELLTGLSSDMGLAPAGAPGSAAHFLDGRWQQDKSGAERKASNWSASDWAASGGTAGPGLGRLFLRGGGGSEPQRTPQQEKLSMPRGDVDAATSTGCRCSPASKANPERVTRC